MIHIPFLQWLMPRLLVGGDWRFFWPENIKEILSYASAWDSSLNTGIGRSNLPILWLDSYLGVVGNFLNNFLHIPWILSEKILFFWPIIFLSFFSAFFLSKKIFKNSYVAFLSGVIYLANTYSFMIFSGGQVGIGIAYGLAPFLLLTFLQTIDAICLGKTIKKIITFSLIETLMLSLSILVEPRIALLIMGASFLYLIVLCISGKSSLLTGLKTILFGFILPGLLTFLTHAFWILPILLSKSDVVAQEFPAITSSANQFFSFAFLENSLSLLHPNWPENLFGKTYFMRPEFILVPILAFLSLYFVKKLESFKRIKVLYLVALALAGAFLAKGVNDPFGNFYQWLLNHLYGFSAYRDPTKFYLLIAIAYSLLIPFSLFSIAEIIKNKTKKEFLKHFFVLVFIIYWIFLLRPSFAGQVQGTFAYTKVPSEYSQLHDYLKADDSFYRTFWIPQKQRFAYFTNSNPALSAQDFLNTSSPSAIVDTLTKSSNQMLLNDVSVKYIIVPFDPQGEIFQNDRKYDESLYQKTVRLVTAKLPYHLVEQFGKILIFSNPNAKDHFYFLNNKTSTLSYKEDYPSQYELQLNNVKKGEILVFSEGYNKEWVLQVQSDNVYAKPYEKILNSFIIPKDGTYKATLSYQPQKWVDIGHFVSAISLGTMLLLLILVPKWYNRKI